MKPQTPSGTRLIRNSTAEFLIFTGQAGEQSIEARYEDETDWLSQKLMATLFDVEVSTINEHLKNIYASGELTREATVIPVVAAAPPRGGAQDDMWGGVGIGAYPWTRCHPRWTFDLGRAWRRCPIIGTGLLFPDR